MTSTIIELTEEAFAAQYRLRTNHLNPSASWACGEGAGCLFETYGVELAFVRQQNPRTVWTLIDGDNGDPYILSGLHPVNRLGYLVSTAPVPEGTTIRVRIPIRFEQAAEATAHTPEPWFVQPSDHPGGLLIKPIPGQVVAQCDQVPEMKANARRICAAVNACKGIGTEALERGKITELWHVLGELLTAAGDLDAAINGATGEFDTERARLTPALHAAQAILDGGMALDLHELLAGRRQIAAIWCIEDVQEVRPDLTGDQAWEVLQEAQHKHDAMMGISWDTLPILAEDLFGPAPETADEEE